MFFACDFLPPQTCLCISARRASFLATKQGEQPGSAASAAEHTDLAPFLNVHTSTAMEHISNGLQPRELDGVRWDASRAEVAGTANRTTPHVVPRAGGS